MPNSDADRYRNALARIGISMRELARLLGLHDTVTRRWGMTARNTPPPPEVMTWLAECAANPNPGDMVRTSLPAGWKARTDPLGLVE